MTAPEASDILFRSEGGNNYIYSKYIPQVMLLHPILNYLLTLEEKEGIQSIEQWIGNIGSDEIEIEKGFKVTGEELDYYYRYFLFLRRNRYFQAVDKKKMTGSRYDEKDIRHHLANTQQIVYEVVDFCNLDCKYCGYGHLYAGYDKRIGKKLNVDTAKRFFDYMVGLFKSPLNKRSHKVIYISFYGGEPLLNIDFIKEMVKYVNRIRLINRQFRFSMTTNAVCLEKYTEYLVKNDFSLLISLDGDKNNNGYRVFHDGKPSFDIVFKNILNLKEKYPGYFKRKVRFMSVLHNKNSYTEINDFFKKQLGIEPQIAEVSPLGIKPGKKEEYERIFKPMYTGLTTRDLIRDIKDKERILKTPVAQTLSKFIHRESGFVFNSYKTLLYGDYNPCFVHTGTCNPFERKVFITANGKILPCERISQKYSLGKVDKNGVSIDFREIAAKYNRYYKKIMNQCNRCANGCGCTRCIFTLDLSRNAYKCKRFKNQKDAGDDSRKCLSLLEETPIFYTRIMNEYKR